MTNLNKKSENTERVERELSPGSKHEKSLMP